MIPPGKSKKLHHPWTGPYKILDKISDSDYKIKGLRGKKQCHIVHFDRLKLCTPGTRFDNDIDDPDTHPDSMANEQTTTSHIFGQDMDILADDEPTRRYPQRDRHPPVRFAVYHTYLKFGTNFQWEGGKCSKYVKLNNVCKAITI